jgi:hypothetical protein
MKLLSSNQRSWDGTIFFGVGSPSYGASLSFKILWLVNDGPINGAGHPKSSTYYFSIAHLFGNFGAI